MEGGHEHEHSHEGDASHDHAHPAASAAQGCGCCGECTGPGCGCCPGCPAEGAQDRAPAVASAAADESAWDGPAAMSWASSQDDPEAAFRAICAGEKTTGEPDTQAHWALPHHKHSGDPPNRKGVSSALGRLDQTDDLASKSAAQAHLEAHQRAMGDGGTDDHGGTGIFTAGAVERYRAALKGARA